VLALKGWDENPALRAMGSNASRAPCASFLNKSDSGGGVGKPHGRSGAKSIPPSPPFFAFCKSYEWHAMSRVAKIEECPS
jgi:hypothetical protein